MTPEQIIQRVRELTRHGLVYVNLGKNDELADLAPKMADAYEYVARELAEARSERDALKAKVEQIVTFLNAIPIQRRELDRDEWIEWLFSVAQHQLAILKGEQ